VGLPLARPYKVVAVAIGLVILALFVARTIDALLVVFGGYLFALLLHGVAAALARRLPLPYGAWVTILVVALFGSTAAFVIVAGPSLRDQVVQLADLLPKVLHDLATRIRHTSIAPSTPSAPLLGSNAGQFALGAFAAVGTTLEVVGAFVVVIFLGVYGAARPSDYTRVVLGLVPRQRRVRALRIIRHVNHNLTRWLLGRLVAMFFVGISCAIAFSLLDVPLGMSLALLAGLLTFVEYVGAVVSAIPPFLLALSHSTTSALFVLLVFTGLHVVEGYILTPLLARASVRFPPALTLANQLAFAALIGPLGLTFSTPLLIVVVSGAEATRSRYERSPSAPRRRRTGYREPPVK
jgi:predicted PurR-regulated permease PerM